MSETRKMRIYGCGGAGVNLVAPYGGVGIESGCAEILPALVDTSASNLRSHDAEQLDVYLVQGLDGSGKIRAENYNEIKKSVKQVLVDIRPADFNVVVFSASGGSGSVIGPLIMSELLSRDLPAIAIVIGSDDSVIAAENTLKTLQSLELIAANTQHVLPMSYHQNPADGRRSTVDADVRSVIGGLAILVSGQNQELDSRDIHHWLQYSKLGYARPALSMMHMAISEEEFKRVTSPLSVASLYHSTDQAHLVTEADYHTVGYANLQKQEFKEIHYAIGVHDLAMVGASIQKNVDRMKEARAARVSPDGLLSGVDVNQAADGDMML